MRRFLSRTVFAAVFVILAAVLTGCASIVVVTGVSLPEDAVYEAEVGEFDLETVELRVSYSNGKEELLPLTSDMISAADQLKLYRPGKQEIRVTVGKCSCMLTVQINRKRMTELTLAPKTVPYDGKPHSLTVTGDLPEKASVKYPNGNVFTSAGSHEVTAIVVCDGYEAWSRTETLTITPAEYDLSGMKFENRTAVYSGNAIQLTAENIPTGLTVSYEMFDEEGITPVSEAVNVGTYRVVLSAVCDDTVNYQPIEPKIAFLTILPATYDLSGLSMQNKTVTYDGKPHTIALSGTLPEGVSVKYSIRRLLLGTSGLLGGSAEENAVNAGTYQVIASFTGDGDNYTPIPEMRAVLTIEKAVVELLDLSFAPYYCDFDGEPHSVTVQGELPKNVSVSYLYNGAKAESAVRAGTYEVRAIYTCADPLNYRVSDLPDEWYNSMLVIRTITESAEFSADCIFFDPDAAEGEDRFTVEGVAEGINVALTFSDPETGEEVPADALVLGNSYEYVASFTFTDPDRQASSTIPDVTGSVMLRQKIVVPSLTMENLLVPYDGESHSILLKETLPDGVITYTGNGKTEVGIYGVTANVDRNYLIYCEKDGKTYTQVSATLQIVKRSADLAALHIDPESLDFIYDGEVHSAALVGAEAIPDWVTVVWKYNDEILAGVTDAGKYNVSVSFEYDTERGELELPLFPLRATLSISLAKADLSGLRLVKDQEAVAFDGTVYSVTYDGTAYTFSLVDENGTPVTAADLPAWVDVVIFYNGATGGAVNAGTYTVLAHFEYDTANYEIGTEDLTATLTINKAKIDTSGLDLSPHIYYYQEYGTPVTVDLDVSSLPADVEIVGLPKKVSYLGKWDSQTFWVSGDNYEEKTITFSYEIRPTRKCLDPVGVSYLTSGAEFRLNYIRGDSDYLKDKGSHISLLPLSVTDSLGHSVDKGHLAPGEYTWSLTSVYDDMSEYACTGQLRLNDDGTWQFYEDGEWKESTEW